MKDFGKIYQLKGLKPKKERPDDFLWMLWFDKISLSKYSIYYFFLHKMEIDSLVSSYKNLVVWKKDLNVETR